MRIDKDNIKIILILLVICLSLGYAYINSDLNINGTAQVKHANWDIHWANIQVTNGSVSASTPTISSGTTVTYSVTLTNPGDYYEFTVDAVNGGQIDAMIDTIDSKLNNNPITSLPAYLNYSVTYEDGVELESNHMLKANVTEKYKVRIEYRTDIEVNQLPTTNQSLSLQFTVTYRQATDDATEVDHVIKYTISSTEMHIGQPIPNTVTVYNTVAEVLDALRAETGDNIMQIYLKHKIQEGVVTESYIEFIVTPEMVNFIPNMTAGTYEVRGLDTYDANAPSTNYCKSEYYDSTTGKCLSPYYASNKETSLRAFSSSQCTEYVLTLDCFAFGSSAVSSKTGLVTVGTGMWSCNIDETGSSVCTLTVSD